MICPNCQSETNGLKLNNRLYCTECGFDLSTPEEPKKPEPKPVDIQPQPAVVQPVSIPEPKITRPDPEPTPTPKPVEPVIIVPEPVIANPDEKIVSDLDLLKSEEAVLDLIEDEAENLEKSESQKQKKTNEKVEEKPNVPAKLEPVEDDGSVVIPTKAKLPISRNTIKKHERPRTDLKKEGDFELIPGEPDPIAEPELVEGVPGKEATPAPEKLVEEEPKKGEGVASNAAAPAENPSKAGDPAEEKELDKVVEEVRKKAFDSDQTPKPMIDIELKEDNKAPDDEDEPAETADKKPKTDFLVNFMKQATQAQPSNGKKTKTKAKKARKTNSKFRWKLFLSIFIPIVLIFALVSLVLYVRLYAGRPEVITQKAESSANFAHLKPSYVPLGYSIDLETAGTANSITYSYAYLPDKSQRLTVKAEKTTITEDTIKDELIAKENQEYTNARMDNLSFWRVGNTKLYFVSNGVLYTITGNDSLAPEELNKIATGLK